jgi:hypothetical protein
MARARIGRLSVLAFDAITVEGALISPAMLARIAKHDANGQSEADYGVPKGLTLRDEIARYFRMGQALHAEITASSTPSMAATTAFIEKLLRDVFGFGDVARVGTRTLGDRQFAVTLEGLGGRVPAVVVPPGDELDRPSELLAVDGRRRSAASAIQDWVNASEDAVWGLCSNGVRLRLVRDNASLTRPAYIEASLRRIFEDELFADFAALWLLVHASRFGRAGAATSDCTLERWRDAGQKEGRRAVEELSKSVEAALLTLGNGFLSHFQNGPLRERLRNGEWSLPEFFSQLLRLVYRLIFLLAAEDRNLLHPPSASVAARKIYAEGYSVGTLRDRAVRRAAWDRNYDRWEGLLITFAALARGEPRLGLPALDGLFAPATMPDLEAARLANRSLMEAIYRLAWLREDSGLVPVNWRDMETEELGSVYESLLELTPRLTDDGHGLAFAEGGETKGHARKTTGSYYTPDSLVQALLDSALDPVLDRVEAEADDPAAALLSVTVLDPACGSGHFLLAAARRIATRLARDRAGGVASPSDFRHALRDVARACIHGVDRNPMAVELTKVALWIETVEPGKPLGFLDANIRCGDSLLGVFDLNSLEDGIPDAAYKPLSGDDKETAKHFAKRSKAEREGQGSLDFAKGSGWLPAAAPLAGEASALRAMPEDSAEEIAAKRKRFEAARGDPRRWSLRIAADLYVAAFLSPKTGGVPANRNTVTIPTTAHIWDALAGRTLYGPLVGNAQDLAGRARAFHWPLEFPDSMAAGGFDVVLGNPPWERIKLQEQEFFAAREPEIAEAPNAAARGRLIAKLAAAEAGTRERALYNEFENAKRTADAASVFAREGDRFPLTGHGDVNTYALFAELFATLAGPRGRAGLIVPTGIATDATTAPFFGVLLQEKRLFSLHDFQTGMGYFDRIGHARFKFCLLTVGRKGAGPELPAFSFFSRTIEEFHDRRRHFVLSRDVIAKINPNTITTPIFRTAADAELTAKIHARVAVLVDETKDADGNPWNLSFLRMFDMANDSGLFRTAAQLSAAGFLRDQSDWVDRARTGGSGVVNVNERKTLELVPGIEAVRRKSGKFVPLYEAKLANLFDHRASSYAGATDRGYRVLPPTKIDDHRRPDFEIEPFYWVPEDEVLQRLAPINWKYQWLIAWRDITHATNERTIIVTIIPAVGVGHSAPLMFPSKEPRLITALVACANSLTLDYCARTKLGGLHLTYFYLKQFPVLPPSVYTPHDLAFIVPRVLELTYTSRSLAPFARDVGYDGAPFVWDEDRRAQLRAELDAWYARAYGLTRDELRYVLDPADLKGSDYPSETFRVLKKNEIARFGEYRTARLVLQAWDRMERAEIAQISPPMVVSTPTTAATLAPVSLATLPDGAWARPSSGDVGAQTLAQLAAVLKALPGPTAGRLARLAALYALEPRLLTPRLTYAQQAEWRRLVGAEAEPRDGVVTFGLGGAIGWGQAVRVLAATGGLKEDTSSETWAPGQGLDFYVTDTWPRRAIFSLEVAAAILADDSAASLSTEEEIGLNALAA